MMSKKIGGGVVLALVLVGCQSGPAPMQSQRPLPPPPPQSSEPAAPTQGAPSATYVVTRGSQSALQRYPRGTKRTASQKVCLRSGESLTLVNPRTSRRITYGGPGCNKRIANPPSDQSGATTIGPPL